MKTREMLIQAARALGDLSSRVVFTGGATIAEYLDLPPLEAPRPTIDVDVVVELATRREYNEFMGELDGFGWSHPQLEEEAHPICRRRTPNGLLVDVMPSDPSVLGFANRWYAEGFARTFEIELDDACVIHLFPADVLLASKLQAFADRGRGDWYASHDLEDVITVLEGRAALLEEVQGASPELREFVRNWAETLRRHRDYEQIVEAHLHPSLVRAGRLEVVLEAVEALDG